MDRFAWLGLNDVILTLIYVSIWIETVLVLDDALHEEKPPQPQM